MRSYNFVSELSTYTVYYRHIGTETAIHSQIVEINWAKILNKINNLSGEDFSHWYKIYQTAKQLYAKRVVKEFWNRTKYPIVVLEVHQTKMN